MIFQIVRTFFERKSQKMVSLAPDGKPKGSRVLANGCYDLFHFNHALFLRQSKLYGKKLIVGVFNDEEVETHKGYPVFTEEERCTLTQAVKWVDDVVCDAPYKTTGPSLNQHDCDFCVCGQSLVSTFEGKDSYEEVKRSGRFRQLGRYPGISTLDVVGRVLSNHRSTSINRIEDFEKKALELSTDKSGLSPWTLVIRFNATAQAFEEVVPGRTPALTDKVVYVCGGFDVFNIGHLSFLEAAKDYGHYLIVGVYSDDTISGYGGTNGSILSLQERVLNLLPYKIVDAVIIAPPFKISQEMINRFRIQVVVDGKYPAKNYSIDPFEVPKKKGIHVEVETESDVTTEKVVQRIKTNRSDWERRNKIMKD
ncbi:unnamed protein product [Caenorhabditis auriculariae]|uniref:ethanolamine-phosphate cytidylyltransferase n=1 Tax=Caenorhabditis auriculariae TaxID=2777116 RepID=A0A8S1H5L3_9PELO|nr:unnamed protein product [Caenorhabditis auriculariae]